MELATHNFLLLRVRKYRERRNITNMSMLEIMGTITNVSTLESGPLEHRVQVDNAHTYVSNTAVASRLLLVVKYSSVGERIPFKPGTTVTAKGIYAAAKSGLPTMTLNSNGYISYNGKTYTLSQALRTNAAARPY